MIRHTLSTPTVAPEHVAFLCIGCGGTAWKAAQHIAAALRQARVPSPIRLVHADTDPGPADGFDATVHLPLLADDIEVILADPEKFGPIMCRLVQLHPEFLDPEHSSKGSRTVRLLSQVAFHRHRDEVRRILRENVFDLKRAKICEYVQPIIFCSTGGGAGSALSLLLADAIAEGNFRDAMLTGLNVAVHRPAFIVIDPYAYADANDEIQANKILANISAFRDEIVRLQQRNVVEDVYFQGLANDGGTVIDTDVEMARVLGMCVFDYMRNYGPIQSFLTNYKVHAMKGHYSGNDIPEKRFPQLRDCVPNPEI